MNILYAISFFALFSGVLGLLLAFSAKMFTEKNDNTVVETEEKVVKTSEVKIFALKVENNKKSRHDGAYLLLKYALNDDCPDIKKTPYGKPYLDGRSDVHFNISHSNEYAVCAVADVPVGIDIELIRPLSEKLIKRFLNDCPPDEAIREWTKRESFGKLTGEGFINKSTEPHVFKEYNDIPGYIINVCVYGNLRANGSRADGFVTPDAEFPEKITWYQEQESDQRQESVEE